MEDFYATLGVTHAATPAIVKIAYEGKKDWYDKQWMKHSERQEEAAVASSRKVWYIASALSVLLVGALTYYYVNRANEREKFRLEEIRMANEKEAVAKQHEIEQAALDAAKDADAARIELAKRQLDSRDRAYSDSLSRSDAARAYAEQSRMRNMELTAQRQQQYDEQRARQQDEVSRRQAQAEVDRQKRYLQQREYEEQRAAAEREARVRYEAAQRAHDAAIAAARANAGR